MKNQTAEIAGTLFGTVLALVLGLGVKLGVLGLMVWVVVAVLQGLGVI